MTPSVRASRSKYQSYAWSRTLRCVVATIQSARHRSSVAIKIILEKKRFESTSNNWNLARSERNVPMKNRNSCGSIKANGIVYTTL